MKRAASRLSVLAASVLSSAGHCGGASCPPIVLPEPMTELRAHELDPATTTGLAVSTTYVSGDCRPRAGELPKDACGRTIDAACARERSPLFVLAVQIRTSVPESPDCGGAYAVADLRDRAVLDTQASQEGELVAPLAAGRYTLYVSRDERCAVCGLADSDPGCVIEVPAGHLAVRDVVLDVSTR